MISIDILIKKNNKVILGSRANKPVQGVFSIGGIVSNNETIDNAMARVALNELNIEFKSTPGFIGVLE